MIFVHGTDLTSSSGIAVTKTEIIPFHIIAKKRTRRTTKLLSIAVKMNKLKLNTTLLFEFINNLLASALQP